jgi:hypothetical protein
VTVLRPEGEAVHPAQAIGLGLRSWHERLVREQSPEAELKAVVRGGSVSVEVRPRG